jgi:hypothetical protein
MALEAIISPTVGADEIIGSLKIILFRIRSAVGKDSLVVERF